MTQTTPLFLEPGEPHLPEQWTRANTGYFDHSHGQVRPSCFENGCPNQAGYRGLPYCEACAWRVWAVLDADMDHQMAEAAKSGYAAYIQAERDNAQAYMEYAALNTPADRSVPGVVYYLRVGDLIKIGFTTSLEQRMRSYPPNAQLLAVHPGTLDTERQMHHRFLHHLAQGREWFTPGDELADHLRTVREQYKQPREVVAVIDSPHVLT